MLFRSLRIISWIVDIFILIIWALGFWGIFYISNIKPTTVIFVIGLLFPIFFYHFLFELLNCGQTPGKMLTKIKVISCDGAEPSFGMYVIRWIFRIVEITLFWGSLAIISILVTKNSQRIGDLLAKTTVISLRIDESERLLLSELDFHDDYKVTYHDVLLKLSDKDIRIIQSIINDEKTKGIYLDKLTAKLKSLTGYSYDGKNIVFLKKVISDYNYLASQL